VCERSDPANAKFVLFLLIPLMASAHERVFAAAVKESQRPVISWLCARTAKERHVCSRSGAVSVYATQAQGTCSVTTCFMTIL
jgi:hypothetical protein